MIDGTHITLSVKPNKQIASSIANFYNRKRFHIIVFQVVCDCDMFFWNACASQPNGVANGRQFKMQVCIICFDQEFFCKNQLLLLKVCKLKTTYLGMQHILFGHIY